MKSANYPRSSTIVMAFFTTDNRGLFQGLKDQMGRAARVVVEYCDGPASTPR